MKINHFSKLIIAIAISESAGIIGSIFTAPSIPTWYAALAKPVLNPPAWIFAPVWTALFAFMGISLFLIWSSYASPAHKATDEQSKATDGQRKKEIKIALGVFFIQLTLNVLWSIIFFGLHDPGLAFLNIIALWIAIAGTIIAFYKISPPSSNIWTTEGHGKLAAYLLLPYIIWVSFAAYLNYAIWMLN
jgi:translocator protein